MARGSSKSDVVSSPKIKWDYSGSTSVGRLSLDAGSGQKIPLLDADQEYDFEIKNGDALGRAKITIERSGYIDLVLLESVTPGGLKTVLGEILSLSKRMNLPVYHDFQVENGSAVGRAKLQFAPDGRVELEVLQSVTRGGGRVAIKAVIDLANEMRLPISLWAQPINSAGGKMMKQSELTDWYKTFGFKPKRMGGYDHASSMVYTPS